jgi:hypothetical protein
MPASLTRENPQLVIEKLARNRISEAKAEKILSLRIADTEHKSFISRAVDYVTRPGRDDRSESEEK